MTVNVLELIEACHAREEAKHLAAYCRFAHRIANGEALDESDGDELTDVMTAVDISPDRLVADVEVIHSYRRVAEQLAAMPSEAELNAEWEASKRECDKASELVMQKNVERQAAYERTRERGRLYNQHRELERRHGKLLGICA